MRGEPNRVTSRRQHASKQCCIGKGMQRNTQAESRAQPGYVDMRETKLDRSSAKARLANCQTRLHRRTRQGDSLMRQRKTRSEHLSLSPDTFQTKLARECEPRTPRKAVGLRAGAQQKLRLLNAAHTDEHQHVKAVQLPLHESEVLRSVPSSGSPHPQLNFPQ